MNAQGRLPASALLMPLVTLLPILVAVALIAINPDFETNPAVHWVLQIVSAFMLGIGAFIVIRGPNQNLATYDYLLVVGLVCAAFLEAAHGLLITANFQPDTLERLIPWGWLPSRVILPITLTLAILYECRRAPGRPVNKPLVVTVATLATLFTAFSLVVLAFFPNQLPQIYFEDRLVHRPSELLPAVLFFLALASQLRYGNWRGNIYDYTMLLALGVAVIAHSLLMPFAPANFTNLFAAAVGTKVLGYVLILAALILRGRENMRAYVDSARMRYQAIIETANDAIITFDDHGVIDSFNQGASRMFGYSEVEALGANITLLTPHRLRKPHDNYLTRVRNGELPHTNSFNYEATGLRKDGSVFAVESAISEIQIEGRGFYTAIVRDITQRKAEQGRLEEISDRLTMALESAQLGMWEQDLDNGKLSWNARMFELYERDPERGEPDQIEWVEYTIEDDRESCFAAHTGATENGELIDIVYRITLGGDRIRWIRANGKLVEGDGDKPRRLVGVNQDISTSIEHLEEVETARQQADDANRAKSVFLATMSHEIRTPLNGVIGLTEVLNKTQLDAYQSDLTRLIEQSADSLLEIIEDVLDISKIEAGKLEIDPTDIAPKQIVTDVCEMLSNQAEKSNVSLTLEVDRDIPEIVQGDGQRLRQILVNLVNNAIKFTGQQETGGQVAIHTHCLEANEEATTLQFSVTDDGIGMEASTIARLFSPFTQADASTSRKFGGSGLGLTISQRLAEMMGGQITVSSSPGEGSTFVVTLPFQITAPARQDTGWEPAAAGQDEQHINGDEVLSRRDAIERNALILVAEDNETNQAVIQYQLSELGYQADIASNGMEALKAWRSGDYALLLTDLQMPEVDGYELARRVREQETSGRRIPIVALSANTLMDEAENCINVGMDAYLSKPVALSELEATLGQWLDAPEH